MTSLILRTATRALVPLLLLLSIFLLLRGHNEPGGGFIGGLVGAAGFALFGIAFGVPLTRTLLRADPQTIIALGLVFAASSGILSLFFGEPYLTGRWGTIDVPGIGEIAIGTALLFDGGVYLVVVGMTLLIILTLAEE